MKKLILSLLAFVFFQLQFAQTPTWAHDIAPIMYNNCTKCHHDGGLSPFPLMTYSDAQSQAHDIGVDIPIRKMPPWPPDATYQRYAHERLLSQGDINKIMDWLAAGTPSGDTTTAPAPPVYTNGSALGTPDFSGAIQTFTVPASQTTDLYQCFVIPTNLLTNQFVTGIEIVPGNPGIVHHVLIYQDTTAAHNCRALDAAQPGPGYTEFGGIGENSAILVGGWVPGSMPYIYPANFGSAIYANSDLVLQIHYPAGSNNQMDSTRVNLKLSGSVSRLVALQPILNHSTNINTYLHIPANTVMTFNEHYHIPYPGIDISLLTVGPHCHLIGKSWLTYAITPVNDTIPFMRINDWNFHWQGFYEFKNIMKIPALSDLYAYATYDNTVNNPENPSTPPQDVWLGENTTDEMMLVFFAYTVYQLGDENISQDTSALVDITGSTTGITDPKQMIVSTPQLYEAIPNPAKDETFISYFLPASYSNVALKIFDLNGRLADEIKATNVIGFNNFHYNTSKLQSGTYLYSLSADGNTKTKQLVITK